jgi:DNA polymerase III subunit epsilon
MRQIFLDTETTGLEAAQGDRVIEIGCIEMLNRRLTERHLHLYLNPDRKSHPDALRIHGLTEAFLADKPRFAEVVDAFLDFVAGAELIIHNASFDVGFIDAELQRLGRAPLGQHVAAITDTLVMARHQYPGKASSLDALCKRLEIDNTHRKLHGALLDAGLLAEVYVRLTRGQDVLVIEGEENGADAEHAAAVDFTAYTLPVILATGDEIEAHALNLVDIDKASGGRTVWRSLPCMA